jgi:hypothetical protein
MQPNSEFSIGQRNARLKAVQQRNVRIRQMQESGASMADIASNFDMSVEAVRSVCHKLDANAAARQRCWDLLQEFRRADDLDKNWTVAEVLNALRLMTTTRTGLSWTFAWSKTEQISLRGFMELVISERTHAQAGYLITPLLDIRNIGVKGFWTAVGRLTEADLGEKCNREWRRRLARLRQASRIVGLRRTWSKPCELPAWLSKYEPADAVPQTAAPPLKTGRAFPAEIDDHD